MSHFALQMRFILHSFYIHQLGTCNLIFNKQTCRWLSRRNLRGGQTQNKGTSFCSSQALNTFKKEGGGFLLRKK